MKPLLLAGAALALSGSYFLWRPVIHAYTEHAHLDVFHLVVSIVAAVTGVFLLYRASRRNHGVQETARRA